MSTPDDDDPRAAIAAEFKNLNVAMAKAERSKTWENRARTVRVNNHIAEHLAAALREVRA